MKTWTLILGSLLVLLGGVSYLATGRESVTALIPAFFGIGFLVLSWLAQGSRLRPMMHAAVGLAILGLAGSARGIPGLVELAGGGDVERPAAAVAQSVMAVLCLITLGIAIRGFLAARRES